MNDPSNLAVLFLAHEYQLSVQFVSQERLIVLSNEALRVGHLALVPGC